MTLPIGAKVATPIGTVVGASVESAPFVLRGVVWCVCARVFKGTFFKIGLSDFPTNFAGCHSAIRRSIYEILRKFPWASQRLTVLFTC